MITTTNLNNQDGSLKSYPTKKKKEMKAKIEFEIKELPIPLGFNTCINGDPNKPVFIPLCDIPQDTLEQLAEDFKERLVSKGKVETNVPLASVEKKEDAGAAQDPVQSTETPQYQCTHCGSVWSNGSKMCHKCYSETYTITKTEPPPPPQQQISSPTSAEEKIKIIRDILWSVSSDLTIQIKDKSFRLNGVYPDNVRLFCAESNQSIMVLEKGFNYYNKEGEAFYTETFQKVVDYYSQD